MMTITRLLAVLLLSLSMIACSAESSVLVYKHQYKSGLIDVCEQDEPCIADVEKHFDSCVDRDKVKEMLLTLDPNRSREMSLAISRNTIDCINRASGVDRFVYDPSGGDKT
jgi:hypothetical protein